MATWNELARQQPQLADAGRALLYQHGVGLAFMATIRPDTRPRLHPMCPLLNDDGLFAFIIPSPKQRDLLRDGWYAMHSFPCADNEDAFYVTGKAQLVENGSVRDILGGQFVQERSQFAVPSPATEDALFRFDVDSCLLTTTTGTATPPRSTPFGTKSGAPDGAGGCSRAGIPDRRLEDDEKTRCIQTELMYSRSLIAYWRNVPTSVKPNLRCRATDASFGSAMPASATCTGSFARDSINAEYSRLPRP